MKRRLSPTDNKDRVKKGWFRLWLAIALLWWIGCAVGFIVYAVFDEWQLWNEELIGMVSLAIFPPIVPYIIGRVIYWVCKGFKEDDGSHPPRL